MTDEQDCFLHTTKQWSAPPTAVFRELIMLLNRFFSFYSLIGRLLTVGAILFSRNRLIHANVLFRNNAVCGINDAGRCHKYVWDISIVKPTRCINVWNLFYWSNPLHVSDGLSVHHQELKTACTYCNRRMSNRYCRLIASGNEIK